jgi:hypothetical protein
MVLQYMALRQLRTEKWMSSRISLRGKKNKEKRKFPYSTGNWDPESLENDDGDDGDDDDDGASMHAKGGISRPLRSEARVQIGIPVC